jgi:superfamily II DNA or RNA helicase
MTFLQSINSLVDGSVRNEGLRLFSLKKVSQLQGDPFYATACVRDDRYKELMDTAAYREDKILTVHCECDAFLDEQEVCEHIWAMLLAADARGFLVGDGKHTKLFIEIDTEEDGFADDFDDEDWDWEPDWKEPTRRRTATKAQKISAPKPAAVPKPPVPKWQQQLQALQQKVQDSRPAMSRTSWTTGREIFYVVEMFETSYNKKIYLSVPHRERKQNGEWGKLKFENIDPSMVPLLPNVDDRKILSLLSGAQVASSFYAYSNGFSQGSRFFLSEGLADTVLPLACATGRCFLRPEQNGELTPLAFDAGEPWSFELKCSREGQSYRIAGALRRGEESVDLAQLRMVIPGFAFWSDRVARLQSQVEFRWLEHFRINPALKFPAANKDAWLSEFFRLPHLPRLVMPDDLKITEVQGTPRPRLLVQGNKDKWNYVVQGHLSFEYDGNLAYPGQGGSVFVPQKNELIRRDSQAETEAHDRLRTLGFMPRQMYGELPRLELNTRNLPKVVTKLVSEGWHVEAEGKLYRQPGKIDIEVTTGIDWFELHGKVQFDDTTIGLPELLQALKKGDKTVVLGDGSVGMLPEEWLKKYGLLAGLGKADNGHLKFGRNQAGLLDALLAAQPEARFDDAFAKVRDELRRFEGIHPADAPANFQGELRAYQRDGLGWLHFLNRFGFGGCLADDMGLGKTVQVLAFLEARRQSLIAGGEPGLRSSEDPATRPKTGHPTLVVVPKSLVFNWKAEATRFTPNLRLLDHTGVGRLKPGPHFQEYDLILTTYGTLRRDALEFKDCRFDYCILDEAQAIKNAKSESSKACRLIQANHRLAVTGTPVENHLGELWSLFDFLNPGMLGQASVFQLAGVGARNPEPETRALLSKALRPFLLRRTKEQVAKDLPQKTEQTLFAEMEPEQRKLYNELRDHFRLSLLNKIEKDGIAKSKILILEALLRLRQAACHPGLIDKKRKGDSSAKLDLLMPQLTEVLGEGHKSLVFSQFTSMLSIVRDRLDREKITYEYLDGKTRNRAEKVNRFQTDPKCKLFLISLKAGGVGLNLTAAEYVFLLDPWWNPAVEAQAIDRTHRIGQTNPVFAYRLIVKDTVEEKVLELQNKKRALADAILNCDSSLIRNLGREDLELLLS